MELKVWCEGIPRVVCGVTEQTTCRDVVIALAQAMGKIGQYTLIEKWRQKERLISPEESPVVALSRWGEYANEVQFILTHSESQHKSNGHSGNRLNVESGWTNKLYGFSSHHGKHFSSSSAIRKSLTFSGAHAHPHIVSNLKMNSNHSENRYSVNGSTYVENMKDDNAEMSQPSRTVTSYDVFEGCIENGQRWQHPSSSSSESALSSLSNKADSLIVGGSLDRSRKCDLSHNNHVPQTSDISRNVTSVHDSMSPLHNSVTSAQSTVTSTLNTQPSLPSSDPSRFGLRVDTTPYNPVTTNLLSSLTTSQIKPMSRESNNNIDYKANANLTGQTRDLITDSLSLSKDICDTEKKRKLELLKLVSDQQERIHKQEQDIEKLEADISLIEHFDHAPKENLNTIQELVRLEKLDNEIDNEIQELELVSWEGKLELELEKEQRLQSEIETMRTSLNKCKTELEKVNSKIKDLEEDVSKEKDLQSIEEKHRKEQEAKVLAEISKLQKQVETKAAEYKNQQKSVEDLFADLKKKEAEIEEKQKKISELEKELKDSNMKLFVRSPGDLIRRSLEGQSLFSRVTRSRPSSAQRLHNLDHLKGGVTLTKTPHGLWV